MSSPLAGLVERLRRLEDVFPETARFVRFGTVGASGVLVDCGVTYATFLACESPDVAYLVGIAVAMTWNFFWNRRITFADADSGPLWRQYIGFCGGQLDDAGDPGEAVRAVCRTHRAGGPDRRRCRDDVQLPVVSSLGVSDGSCGPSGGSARRSI